MRAFGHSARTALAISLAATIACSLPGLPIGSPVGSTATSDSPGAASVGTPTQASGVTEQEWVELEPPPPSGILDAVADGVREGRWSYEEGLISALRLFAGEARLAEVFPDSPAEIEGFGLVLEAQRYLREGGDPAAVQEIERLLYVLGPTSDRLLEYANPESAFRDRAPGLAAASSLAEECEQLFPLYAGKGFPPGSGIKCLLYKEGGISGQTVRVFWPIAYFTEPDYADAAYAVVLQSFQRYAKLQPNSAPAQMKGIDVLFMILPEVEDPSILAMVPSAAADDRCLIMVYLGAIQANEAAQKTPDDYSQFAQTIAHEMFHCFQVWNLPGQADDNWGVQDWWGEGTAEYFSNVVYPEVNYEWRWIDDMASHSAERPLVEMSYDNFAFFQFMVQSLGDNGLLNLLGKLPVGGPEASHAANLATWPNIQTLWHDFARAYMDGTIKDTSSKSIPTIPPYVPPGRRIEVSAAEIRQLDAKPFVLERYAITFPQGYRYSLSQVLTGAAEGYLSSRLDTSQDWEDLPKEVSTPCGPVTYYVVLTTAEAAAAFSVELTIVREEEVACDECLIGVWDLNVDSFQEYAEAPFAETPGYFHFLGAGGPFRYGFRADGTLTGEFDFTYAYTLDQENSSLGNDRVDGAIELKGEGLGHYATDGIGGMTMTLAGSGVKLTQTLAINGQEMDPTLFGGSGPNYGAGSLPVRYSCDEDVDKLYLNFLPESSTLPPLLFDRDPSAEP